MSTTNAETTTEIVGAAGASTNTQMDATVGQAAATTAGDACPVCMRIDRKVERACLPCGHTMHTDCIQGWVEQQRHIAEALEESTLYILLASDRPFQIIRCRFFSSASRKLHPKMPTQRSSPVPGVMLAALVAKVIERCALVASMKFFQSMGYCHICGHWTEQHTLFRLPCGHFLHAQCISEHVEAALDEDDGAGTPACPLPGSSRYLAGDMAPDHWSQLYPDCGDDAWDDGDEELQEIS
ncbi:hypothetical protein BJ166DRAFT_586638 [Pestalotiopsis sp. NC0098]|nr:hypothetical protein BJ166DRAFT_586638 [Pestalotiopsis sp. NC0098]